MSTGNAERAGGAEAGGDADVWVGLGLAEAASTARIGPAPVADILAGGRRIRQRRRTVVGALALASVLVLAGGAVTELRPQPTAGHPLVPAGSAPGSGTGGPPSTAAAPAVRDPLTPVRVALDQGTRADGKLWILWQALWPAAPKERAYEQALAVWQDRSPFDPALTKPTEDFVDRYYNPDVDVTNTYFTLDGERLGHDDEGTAPSPGKLDPRSGASLSGIAPGHRGKGDTLAPADVVTLAVGPDVARVKVTWTDGTVTEPPLVSVGDSPLRHVTLARPYGKTAKLWEYLDRNDARLPDSGEQFFRD
ncbi:hypothetical protein AB0O91_17970 [Kitasatospora sp. NPDC089797]|uniref:hypothetical protein n=1 Tax=Kitasatospora sp. NPDC089797 TaxID=3155298 RepID=UPI0034446417